MTWADRGKASGTGVAAFVLGQMCIAAAGTQQIIGSGVEIDMLLPCSFLFPFQFAGFDDNSVLWHWHRICP
jgi:hypothetical protein